MSKKIAVLFEDKVYNQRGRFNAIRNRIKFLSDIADFGIDVFLISTYDPWYVRVLRGTHKVERVNEIVLDGIPYNVLWKKFSIVDYLLEEKFHRAPLFSLSFYRGIAKRIKNYDLISAHSGNCGWIGEMIAKRDGIPYFITWHGSDIHTLPFQNSFYHAQAKRLLEGASCNFFVSKTLSETALLIGESFNYKIIYNGINKSFIRYTDDVRKNLKKNYGVKDDEKVVAFVGNLIEIKNPQLLPSIFKSVVGLYDRPLAFWTIGSGKYSIKLKNECEKLKLPVKLWGAQKPDDMPKFMNCIDVLVLPSKNEGLPLVTVEALSCGANAVGSKVGGIAESIGEENVFPLDDNFVITISHRIVEMLNSHVEQPLLDVFNWSVAAKIEKDVYDSYLKK